MAASQSGDREVEKAVFVGVALSSAAFGAHLILQFQAVCLLIWRRDKRQTWLLIYVPMLLGLSTTAFALNIRWSILSFADHSDAAGPLEYIEAHLSSPSNITITTLFIVLGWLSDTLLVLPLYKVWTLGLDDREPIQRRRRWIVGTVSCIAMLALTVTGSVSIPDIAKLTYNLSGKSHIDKSTSYVIFFVVMNLAITLAITLRVILFHRTSFGCTTVEQGSQIRRSLNAMLRPFLELSSFYALVVLAKIVVIGMDSPIKAIFLPALGQLQVLPPMATIVRWQSYELTPEASCSRCAGFISITKQTVHRASKSVDGGLSYLDCMHGHPQDVEASLADLPNIPLPVHVALPIARS